MDWWAYGLKSAHGEPLGLWYRTEDDAFHAAVIAIAAGTADELWIEPSHFRVYAEMVPRAGRLIYRESPSGGGKLYVPVTRIAAWRCPQPF
jgi:hypothetical protein